MGCFVLSEEDSFVYTPTAGYTGTASFTYVADDGQDTSNEATVSITVRDALNNSPLAVDDNFFIARLTNTVQAQAIRP